MKNRELNSTIKPMGWVFLSLLGGPWQLLAGSGLAGALTGPSCAKFSAMGGAATAAKEEISAFSENPAALQSLKSGQALFLFQKGLLEDSYGRFMIGTPGRKKAWGLSMSYYNAGTIDLSDGVTTRSVAVQKDLALSLGHSFSLGNWDVGVAGKYFQSTLIESYQATAYAADVGLGYDLATRLHVGAALQNFGTSVTYLNESDRLPRIARMGASYQWRPNSFQTTLFVDAPYFMNDKELRPSMGLEFRVGPLAIRGGLKKNSNSHEISLGTGFLFSRMALDYSLGMQQDQNSVQRFSLTTRFGGPPSNKTVVGEETPTLPAARENHQFIGAEPTITFPKETENEN